MQLLLKIKNQLSSLRAVAALMVVLALVIIGLMLSTTPGSVGLGGVVLFFFLIYLFVFAGMTLAYLLRRRKLNFKAGIRIAVAALAPVMLLALSSTNRLGPLDILLVGVFEIAALFYVTRMSQ